MSPGAVEVDTATVAASADALAGALRSVSAARAALEAAAAESPDRTTLQATRARIGDLAHAEQILEHARNVLGTVAAASVGHDSADSVDRGQELVYLLATSADQFLKMSEPIRFAPVPDVPAPGHRPLPAEYVLADGIIRIDR